MSTAFFIWDLNGIYIEICIFFLRFDTGQSPPLMLFLLAEFVCSRSFKFSLKSYSLVQFFAIYLSFNINW